jgi:hypothetical protein
MTTTPDLSTVWVGTAVGPGTPANVRRAVRAVAALSRDADDCAHLLDVLGLHPADGKLPNPDGGRS